MSLHSRLHDLAKSADAALGRPLAHLAGGARRPLPAAPRDVLCLRLWGLGNLVLLGPHLLAAAAQGRVRLMTLARHAGFVRRHLPGVELLDLPDPLHPACAPQLLQHLAALRAAPPQVVLDAEQFLRLPLLAVRAACPAPTVGLDTPGQGRGPLLDRAVRHDPTRHVADTFAALARAAGLPAPPPGPWLAADPAAQARVDALLERGAPQAGRLIVLHPGSGDHFSGRRWPVERYARLARALALRPGVRLVVTGLPDERRLVRALLDDGPRGTLDLCGALDAPGLLALLARADLLVTNDTGPLHLADALGTPCVALYGPNTPHRYGPRGPRSRALFADLPCSPCLDDRSMKRSSCRDHRCLRALEVDAVLAACEPLLQPRAPSRMDAHAATR